MNSEELKIYMEYKRTKAYGPPEVRTQKRQKYIDDLVNEHSELLIRQIFFALKKSSGFKQFKKIDPAVVPLNEVLLPFHIPWFYFKKIKIEGVWVEVDLTHGVWMASKVVKLLFQMKNDELIYIGEELISIS